jgi:hypothetical protein
MESPTAALGAGVALGVDRGGAAVHANILGCIPAAEHGAVCAGDVTRRRLLCGNGVTAGTPDELKLVGGGCRELSSCGGRRSDGS